MTTKPIQPVDIIFVVDYQTEEIYEMCAGEFARQYSGFEGHARYDENADAYYAQTTDMDGNVHRFAFCETYEEAAYDLFLRLFSEAAMNESFSWHKTREQAELNFSIYNQTR